VAMRITEINRKSRFRSFAVTELHRSPYRGPGGFGRSTPVTAQERVNCPFPKPQQPLRPRTHMGASDSPSWNTQQPATEMSDEELAHAYFAAPRKNTMTGQTTPLALTPEPCRHLALSTRYLLWQDKATEPATEAA
jgi:hypothetical protein